MTKKTENHPKKQQDERTIEGVIHLSYREVGYVEAEQFDEDVEISSEDLNTALNGDRVRVVVTKKSGNRPQGEVVEILEREKTEFVGVIRKSNGLTLLEPDDQRMYRDLYITNPQMPGAESGLKAHVEMTSWKDPKQNPEGVIKKILGKHGEHDVEMNSIVLEHGFRVEFPNDVQKEAEAIQQTASDMIKKEAEHRRDIRGITTFTIDPWDAKDFDDGLSFQDLGNNEYEIGIHIADVSHYVTPESELDKEARKRGFSVYLVDRTIPMLPEELSNDICSLNPDEDKLAFSAIFQINKNGSISDRWFGRTVIRSDKRFTYEEAQKEIDAKSGAFPNELTTLNEIAKTLAHERFKNGAIDFETDEVTIELDENNDPKKIYKKERLDTHKLIEEFMLLANRNVARFISEKQKNGNGKFIYRIHDEPNPERIESLSVFAEALGHPLVREQNGSITSHNLNKLLESIKDEASEDTLKIAAIRSMAKAVYSTKNIGHYGLAFDYYTHFTSPIRRYPDLIVHRFLGKYTAGEKISPDEFKDLKTIAEKTSEQELEAMQAERDSVKYKQVEYMLKHVGEAYDGVISGVTDRGLFVAEETTGAEGLIRLRDMKDDYYTLDESGYTIVGERTGAKYQIGDEIKIEVAGGDLERKQLDYKLVSS